MEYFSAIKRNELLSYAATWMDLEIVTLNEIRQTEKDKYMLSFTCPTTQTPKSSQAPGSPATSLDPKTPQPTWGACSSLGCSQRTRLTITGMLVPMGAQMTRK